jgi:hypothetical protein
MRSRSTNERISNLKKWLRKNKTASWREFVQQTGGTQTQYYHLRNRIGIAKANPALSEAMRDVAKRKREALKEAPIEPTAAEIRNKENEEFLAGKVQPKQEVVTEGVAPDFIWYEMDLMQRRLGDVSTRLNHVMKVAQARDADQKKMMRDLISENTSLRVENNGLKQQVSELTEMINGAPV